MQNSFFKTLPFLSILFFTTLIIVCTISCSSHNKKSVNQHYKSSEIQSDTIRQSNFLNYKNQIDHLFFIEGQLCQHLRVIYQDKKKRLWLGTNIYGLLKYENDDLQYLDKDPNIGGGRFTGILEDKNGNVWFSTSEGLIQYNGQKYTLYELPKNGNFYNELWCIFIDSKGVFWIGSQDGVFQFDGQKFKHFPIPKASVNDTNTLVNYNRITNITEDNNGNIWIGTDGFGICQYDGQKFKHFTKANGLADNNISEMLKDKNGDIWIATNFGGMSLYKNNKFTNFTQDGIIQGMETKGLFEDTNGDIWFAAENEGVYCFNGKSFKKYGKKEGLSTNGILCIHRDRENRFWFGGWGGLFLFNGNTFNSVTKKGPWK